MEERVVEEEERGARRRKEVVCLLLLLLTRWMRMEVVGQGQQCHEEKERKAEEDEEGCSFKANTVNDGRGAMDILQTTREKRARGRGSSRCCGRAAKRPLQVYYVSL